MLCGVPERRKEMIEHHESVARLFEIIEIAPLDQPDVASFFKQAFASVATTVDEKAMFILTYYAAGFLKVMHLLGDAAFWSDGDGVIDETDAVRAVFDGAEEFGKRFVDHQVYSALQSKDYKAILGKIGAEGPAVDTFTRKQVLPALTDSEKRKFDNFLQKMKALQVIRQGEATGE